jgi:hypothetical protein
MSLLLVALTASIGCRADSGDLRVDKVKLEQVYRSAKALESSIGVGVNYARCSELLQQFNTELSIARDKSPTPPERDVLDNYAEAIPIYRDSLALWALKIEKGRYLSDYGPAKELADKYGIPRESTTTIDTDRGIQIIWAKAAEWLAKGHAGYART